MMKGEGGQSNIKCRIAEGQGFRHSLHRRAGAGIPLGNHRGRRFDRGDAAVRGFVITGSGSHIQNALGVTQGIHDQLVDARVRAAGGRIPNADALVDLVVGVQSLLSRFRDFGSRRSKGKVPPS